MLAISGEYSTGMIRVTLAAMPRRSTVLAAKAAVVAGLVLAAGTVAVLASVLAGRLILPGRGFTPAHGYPPLSLATGRTCGPPPARCSTWRLIALLGPRRRRRVRDSAAAIGAVLGLLYLFPVIAAAVPARHWQRHLEQIGPMTAGLDIQATTGATLSSLPLTPWAGLACWPCGPWARCSWAGCCSGCGTREAGEPASR